MPLDMVKDGHLGGYIRGGDPGTWCPNLWKWAIDRFTVQSVLDVGCGEGHSTRYFRHQGCQALGLDGCRQAIADSVAPKQVILHDFCEGPYDQHPCDLVWSCEFLEHVEERFLPNVLKTFAAARKAILVTHAFRGQDDGHHHVNCRASGYWIRKIESLGFVCDRELTLEARKVTLADYPGVNHFARSGLVFLNRTSFNQATPASSYLGAYWKGWRINSSFRHSPECKEQKRRRREAKRIRRAA